MSSASVPIWGSMPVPLARAIIRFAPSALKQRFWDAVVEPYLAWKDHRFEVRTVAGTMGGTTKDILQQYLYYFGIWEPQITAFINERLRPGDGFIDVGANIGYFSLLAARRVGGAGVVLSIEASPQVCEQLARHVKRNSAAIRVVNCAASDCHGTLPLYAGGECNCGAATLAPHTGAVTVAMVPTIPLDEVITPAELRRAKLVKIDVEGAEASVLAGMPAFIAGCRKECEFLIEIHPAQLGQMGHGVEDVLRPLRDAGFYPYLLENPYEASEYLQRGTVRRPQRLRDALDCDCNVVFSRQDAAAL